MYHIKETYIDISMEGDYECSGIYADMGIIHIKDLRNLMRIRYGIQSRMLTEKCIKTTDSVS